MPEYFKVDSRKITCREYWKLAPNFNGVVLCAAKLLNIPIKMGSPVPGFVPRKHLEISEQEFLPAAREKLNSLINQTQNLGFHSPRYFAYCTLARETQTFSIYFLHGSNELLLRLSCVVTSVGTITKYVTGATLLSEFQDNGFLLTTNKKATLDESSAVREQKVAGSSLEKLLQLHKAKIDQLTRDFSLIPVENHDALDAVADHYELDAHEYNCKLGRVIPLDAKESSHAKLIVEETQILKASGVENADILVQIKQLQTKKSNWGSTILILIISILAFVGAGSSQWTWKYALLLVPILLFHELGHYLAMKAFNYTNLKMFFIPFFGAAVSGRHYNVAGWKKVLVSLMGPLPGIVLGMLIGAAGLFLHNPLLIKVGLVTLVLNGFNLIPILPLDGGWICQNLLFTRHYLLDIVFRVIAILALVTQSAFSSNRILMFVGISMAIGLPVQYRIAKIVTRLRRNNIPVLSEDEQSIPDHTAQVIIAEVKQALPKVHAPKIIAEHTLQIFETLNCRPPGWPVTIAFLFIQGASIAAAVIMGAFLVLGRDGDLGTMLAAAANQEAHRVSCDKIVSWKGPDVVNTPSTNLNTIIATFNKQRDAQRYFQSLTNRLPADVSLKLFGESVLLVLPSNNDDQRKNWVAEFQSKTKDVVVNNTNFSAVLTISCLARDAKEAHEIEEEFNNYAATFPTLGLIPPWTPAELHVPKPTPEQVLARKSYILAQKSVWTQEPDTKLKELYGKAAAARKSGDKSEAVSVMKDIQEHNRQQTKSRLAALIDNKKDPVDPEIISLYSARDAAGTNLVELGKIDQSLAKRMGQIQLMNGQPDPKLEPYAIRSAFCSTTQLLIHFSWMNFNRVDTGSAAFVDWLCKKGCIDFKYRFISSEMSDEKEID